MDIRPLRGSGKTIDHDCLRWGLLRLWHGLNAVAIRNMYADVIVLNVGIVKIDCINALGGLKSLRLARTEDGYRCQDAPAGARAKTWHVKRSLDAQGRTVVIPPARCS